LELAIRLGLAELLLEANRFLEAEEEMRRAEQVAIAGNFTQRLVQVYTLMGRLRGRQRDETGFVFFEQAIELCRTLERSPTAEGQVYLEYGLFRESVDQMDEARAYLERAREIFAAAGETGERDRVDAELQKMSA
jgi:tetratricopeptide (TPR) repeat protein